MHKYPFYVISYKNTHYFSKNMYYMLLGTEILAQSQYKISAGYRSIAYRLWGPAMRL